MRFLYSEHFFKADKNVEVFAFYSEQSGENLCFATLKDGEQIFFMSLQDLICYDVLGEDVTRIYVDEEDVNDLLDSDLKIKNFFELGKLENFDLVIKS